MAVKEIIKRKHKRYALHKHVHFKFDSESGFALSAVFPAITIDSSKAGMSLYVYQSVVRGDHVRISKDIYSKPSEKAVVRWARKIDHDLYKAGVSLEPADN